MSSALELDAVSVAVADRSLLAAVRLRLAPGELVALVGRNGAGKSTLLRAALGLVRPAAGEVRLGGRTVSALSGRERAARIAWLPQQAIVREAVIATDLVAAARFRFDETRAAARAAAHRALARAGAADLAARVVTSLSGGEQQRVAIAALLAQEAPLLLMDEPASHLDPGNQVAMYRLIGELWRGGDGVLCVTHDVNLLQHSLAADEADRIRVVGLEAGQILFEHAFSDPRLADALSRLFGVPITRVSHSGASFFAPLPAAGAVAPPERAPS